MKKTLFIASLLSIAFVGCKDSKQESVETADTIEATHDEIHVSDPEINLLNNSWTAEMHLDEGRKWEANIETTQGVNNMLEIVDGTDPQTVEEYHTLAAKLNEEKNTVVRECTMEGPSHDNLHTFLHPLIEKIDALGKVATIEEGAELEVSIKENLDKYNDYFK